MGLISDSLRITLRRSVSKVPRRYFSQSIKLVGICRNAELWSDDTRDAIECVVYLLDKL